MGLVLEAEDPSLNSNSEQQVEWPSLNLAAELGRLGILRFVDQTCIGCQSRAEQQAKCRPPLSGLTQYRKRKEVNGPRCRVESRFGTSVSSVDHISNMHCYRRVGLEGSSTCRRLTAFPRSATSYCTLPSTWPLVEKSSLRGPGGGSVRVEKRRQLHGFMFGWLMVVVTVTVCFGYIDF
jgi:hypothetical protein